MTKKKGSDEPKGLTIAYNQLGTISVEELTHALLEDAIGLRDYYNIQYISGAYLTVFATNEYGEHVDVRRPGGGKVQRIDTFHYRPACKDYDL